MNEHALSFRGPGAEPSYHYGPFLAITFYESGLISLEILSAFCRQGREQRSQWFDHPGRVLLQLSVGSPPWGHSPGTSGFVKEVAGVLWPLILAERTSGSMGPPDLVGDQGP